jgi:hypothetical protein
MKAPTPTQCRSSVKRVPSVIINDIVIQAAQTEGRIWLAASPLCRALGLKMNSRHRAGRHIARLPETERGYLFMPIRGVLQRCAVVTGEGAVLLAATGRRDGDGAIRAELSAAVDDIIAGAAA